MLYVYVAVVWLQNNYGSGHGNTGLEPHRWEVEGGRLSSKPACSTKTAGKLET